LQNRFIKNEIDGKPTAIWQRLWYCLKMAAATEISDEDAAVLQFPKGKKKSNFPPSLWFCASLC